MEKPQLQSPTVNQNSPTVGPAFDAAEPPTAPPTDSQDVPMTDFLSWKRADATKDPLDGTTEEEWLLDPSNGTNPELPISVEPHAVRIRAADRRRRMEMLQTEEIPQGRHLGLFSTLIIFVSRIVGSGIFATPGGIFQQTGGSPALFFLAWLIAMALSFAGLFVFLELGSLLPRSGGKKVFLEFIYYKPKMLMSVIFCFYSVMFGFSVSNAIVFGQYMLAALGFSDSEFHARLLGFLLVCGVSVLHGSSLRGGVLVQNVLGSLKLFLLAVMAFSGFYALILPKSVTGVAQQLSWNKFWSVPQTVTPAMFGSAVIRAVYACTGWDSVHTVQSEIQDPVRTLSLAGPLALIIVFSHYIFINLAYLVVIPHEEMLKGGQMVGTLLFTKLFGEFLGQKLLTVSVAVSAAGNVLAVAYSISRMNQEVFREGVFPFSEVLASNYPFGAPLAALTVHLVLSGLILLLPPEGNLYDYIINIEGFAGQFFVILLSIGVFVMHRRHPELRAPIRCWPVANWLLLITSIVLCLSPFLPGGNISYAVVSFAFLFVGSVFWAVRFRILPRLGGYLLEESHIELHDGLTVKKWVKVHDK